MVLDLDALTSLPRGFSYDHRGNRKERSREKFRVRQSSIPIGRRGGGNMDNYDIGRQGPCRALQVAWKFVHARAVP